MTLDKEGILQKRQYSGQCVTGNSIRFSTKRGTVGVDHNLFSKCLYISNLRHTVFQDELFLLKPNGFCRRADPVRQSQDITKDRLKLSLVKRLYKESVTFHIPVC